VAAVPFALTAVLSSSIGVLRSTSQAERAVHVATLCASPQLRAEGLVEHARLDVDQAKRLAADVAAVCDALRQQSRGAGGDAPSLSRRPSG
jgi:hypothetical protein